MFELKVSEHEKGKFVQFLEAQGFTYVNHLDKWINKERGHECTILEWTTEPHQNEPNQTN